MVINIARILITILPLLPVNPYPIGKTLHHGRTEITYGFGDVAKKLPFSCLPYITAFPDNRVNFLAKMYEHAQGHRGLVCIKHAPTHTRTHYKVILKTMGLHSPPMDEDNLRSMTKDLVFGLAWLHSAHYLHHDLRISNILYEPAARQYFLIDFERGVQGLEESVEREIEIHGDGEPLEGWDERTLDAGLYTQLSEMYQLGKLLSSHFDHLILSDQAQDFVKKLKGKEMGAREALDHEWICTLP
jgi:serine/threonine protein kinase